MNDDADYELVMPFVVCADRGGPYDPAGFTAGYQMGQIDQTLQTLALLSRGTVTWDPGSAVPRSCLAQLDLIAMGAEFRMVEQEPELDHDDPGEWRDEWAFVRFTNAPEEQDR